MFISDCLIYLFTDWLGGLALKLKDQNVNPLWTDLICSIFLIVSSTSFLQGCASCSSDSSSSFSSSPSLITSEGCLENPETIYSTVQQTMVEIGWSQVESVLLGKLKGMATSFLSILLSNSFSASYFFGHSEHSTQAIFFHVLIFKTIKFKNSRKT